MEPSQATARSRLWLAGCAALGAGALSLWLYRTKRLSGCRLPRLHLPQRHWPRAGSAAAGNLEVLPAEYPQVRRDEACAEVLHGVRVADPYRWLEDPDSAETKAFVDAQNALTAKVLAQCDTIEPFKQLMTQLYDYPRYGCPFKRGSRYYYSYNTGLQAQNVLYSQASLDGEPRLVLDPNKLSVDGTVALMSYTFSKDGRVMSYALSSGGSDWRTVKLLSIAPDGAVHGLPDVLEHVKFSSLAWTHDNKGFFYNRYEAATDHSGELGTETDINLNQQLCYHVLGTPQGEDVLLAAIPEHPTWMMGAEVTDDGRFLLVSVSSGCAPENLLWYVDLAALPRAPSGSIDFQPFAFSHGQQRLPLVKLVDKWEAQYEYVANEGTSFVLRTNLHAPRYRLVRVDVAQQPAVFTDLVPQHDKDLLQWAAALKGDVMVVCWLHDVASLLQLRSLASGGLTRPLALPGPGSVREFAGRREDSEFLFTFTGFTEPGAIFRCDTAQPDAAPELFRRVQLKADFSPDDWQTEQVFVESRDGTKVPMFIVSRKGTRRDGSNPTLLYGYGGFNISLEPSFSVARLAFMLAYGGVYAVANLRGGGEYGIDWRKAGSCRNKQNVFDDFQSCAEHLITLGYCTPSKLTIQGGSNGGLLVAACANQAPHLYACILAQVGVMDMLRFHKFTIGHAWVSDYGSPDDDEDFRYLYGYSPIHNVRPPTGGSRQYPAVMVATADHDDRVVPLHSFKYIATLQYELAGTANSPQRNPLLARIEVRAGHGAGKPTDKIIQETADLYGFSAKVCGAKYAGPNKL